MKVVNIFIASSDKESDYRNLIGDKIRIMSDEWEKKGVRLKMLCWEDYAPEYTGIRKQTEYNEELIQHSDLFFVILKSTPSEYTIEEVEYAQNHLYSANIHCIHIVGSHDEQKEVQKFILSKGLATDKCNSAEDVLIILDKVIPEYINSNKLQTNIAQKSIAQNKYLYATINSEFSNLNVPFGNMVRSVDYIAEQHLNLRCRLNLKSAFDSNYFLALFNNQLTSVELAEVCGVLGCVNTYQEDGLSAVMLYCSHTCAAIQNNDALQTIIKRKEIFTKPFQSIDAIKLDLLLWLNSQVTIKKHGIPGIEVNNGVAYFYNTPIIHLSDIGINGTDDKSLYAELSEYIWQSPLLKYSSHSPAVGSKSIEEINSDIDHIKLLTAVRNVLNDNISEHTESIRCELENRISDLLNGCKDSEEIKEFVSLTTTLIKLLELHLNEGKACPKEILERMSSICDIHDSYPSEFTKIGFDIDNYYNEITRFADSHDIHDIAVECYRMNYANYLARLGKHNKANMIYQLTIANTNLLESSSIVVRTLSMQLYMNVINHYADLDNYEMAIKCIKDIENQISEWRDKYTNKVESSVYKALILACKLKIKPQNPTKYINEAQRCYAALNENWINGLNNEFIDDLYCFLPNIIATVLIDFADCFISDSNDIPKLIDTADYYLCEVITNAEKYARYIEPDRADYFKAQALHNHGRMLTLLAGDSIAARGYFLKALEIRIKYNDNVERCAAIAETYLNIGTTYINGLSKKLSNKSRDIALSYADKALEIYTELNTENHLADQTYIYAAKLLIATIHLFSIRGNRVLAVKLIDECREWNMAHPGNDYEDIIDSEIERFKQLHLID